MTKQHLSSDELFCINIKKLDKKLIVQTLSQYLKVIEFLALVSFITSGYAWYFCLKMLLILKIT